MLCVLDAVMAYLLFVGQVISRPKGALSHQFSGSQQGRSL